MKNTTQVRLLGRRLVSVVWLAMLLVSSAFAQTKPPATAEKPQTRQQEKQKPPVTKQELLTVLQSGGIAPERLLALIRERGVDFQSSITDEAELGKAGASAEIVEAVGANYRPRKKSFAEKFNETFAKPKGVAQTAAPAENTAPGATPGTPPGQGDSTKTVAPIGGTNPPAQSLNESVKQLRDTIKQLKKKKQAKPDANVPAQPQSPPPQTTAPVDQPPPNTTPPASS